MIRSSRTTTDLNEANPEAVAAELSALASSWTWDHQLRPLTEWLDRQLPAVAACPGHDDARCCGRWELAEQAACDPCQGGHWRELEDFEWYVRDVHQRIGYLRDQVERGDPTGAAIFGVQLGAAILQLQLKQGPEQEWLWGREKRESSRQGGRSNRGGGTDEQRAARVDQLKTSKPHFSKENCYRLIAPEFGVKPAAIKVSYRKYKSRLLAS